MSSNDRIERDTFVKAPVGRVWAVLTEGRHVGAWFGQGEPVAVDLRPGGEMTLDHRPYGVFRTLIVTVDEPRHFAYRWAVAEPDVLADEDNSTLVEFFLEPEGDGTRLRVVESGFARLDIPAEKAETASYDSHVRGWTEMIEKARGYAEE